MSQDVIFADGLSGAYGGKNSYYDDGRTLYDTPTRSNGVRKAVAGAVLAFLIVTAITIAIVLPLMLVQNTAVDGGSSGTKRVYLDGELRIQNMEYSSELLDKSSVEFRALTMLICGELKHQIKSVAFGNVKCNIVSVSSGSLVVSYRITVDEVAGGQDEEKYRQAIGKEIFDGLLAGDTLELFEEDITFDDGDLCFPHDCPISSSCVRLPWAFRCDCISGYIKNIRRTCVPIVLCDDYPCKNGAECMDSESTGSSCQCAFGYVGDTCEEVDPNPDYCSSAPCQNGGVCSNVEGGYTCACVEGYEGAQCKRETDYCSASPCDNGGVCTQTGLIFSCACADGFDGDTCETNIDDCAGVFCQNGGVCEDGINQYVCSCIPGFQGDACAVNIDDCEPDPCVHGACTDGTNTYTCACDPGWTGSNCDQDITDCAPDVCNDGECIDGVAGFTCACHDGFTGDFCDTNNDECADSPCGENGECEDGINAFTCTCHFRYTGERCDTEITDCSIQQCLHGQCFNRVTTFLCYCDDGYSGPRCEGGDECAPDPCQNGATCEDLTDAYSCECVDGFDGLNCETNINDCISDPCSGETNVICLDGINTFACKENIIGQQAAYQSSTLGVDAGAERATDMNLNTNAGSGTCTHTDFEANPWWAVDLGGVKTLSAVVIYNRMDCCSERLVEVRIGTTDVDPSTTAPTISSAGVPNYELCASRSGSLEGVESVELACNTTGSFLVVQLQAESILSLCEVLVFISEDI